MKIFRNAWFWLVLIFLLAAVLRFYKLPDYLTFLGDEGRDALVVKRMIVDHKWTLLGPTMSVAGFFVGPIYYYFMVPFLWFFRLDPVGPAVMSSLFGLGTVILSYYFVKLISNSKAALITAFLIAISPKLVEISRFSWNPNPIPFFSILSALLIYLLVKKYNVFLIFFLGICFGVLTQLHYTSLIFVAIMGLVTLILLPRRRWVLTIVLIAVGFVVINIPFLLFEVRHGFVNLKSIFEFVTRRDGAVAGNFDYIGVAQDRWRRLFEADFGGTNGLVVLFEWIGLAGFLTWMTKLVSPRDSAKTGKVIVGCWLFFGVIGIGLYRGQIEEHYFGFLYLLPMIIFGLIGEWLLRKRILLAVFLIYISLLTYISVSKLYFWGKPAYTLDTTKAIAEQVINVSNKQAYNFALISKGNSDHAYRYFLEIWNKKPVEIQNPQMDPLRSTVTDQLIVVCEQVCAPLGHPLWEVAGFGRAQIAEKAQGSAGITVYKLVHYKE